jgi:hypothetical protein
MIFMGLSDFDSERLNVAVFGHRNMLERRMFIFFLMGDHLCSYFKNWQQGYQTNSSSILFSLVLCGCTLNMPTVQSFFLTVKLSYPLISFRNSFFRVSLGDFFGFLFPYTCSI